MENELRNLNHMRDILDHMHKIGGEWYRELVALQKENADLKKENARLDGLEKLITERINSLHKNIDEKSLIVLNRISEVHTTDVPAIKNQIVATKNSIAPLIEAKKFYDDKSAALNLKQAQLNKREEKIKNDEENIRNENNKLVARKNQLDALQRRLDEQQRNQNTRQDQLDRKDYELKDWHRRLEEQ